jgi:hypothetical protein
MGYCVDVVAAAAAAAAAGPGKMPWDRLILPNELEEKRRATQQR